MKPERKYDNLIRNLITSIISEKDISFKELCLLCEGAFPTTILEISNQITKSTGKKIKPDRNNIDFLNNSELIPEPHLIDFDWRYDDQTASKIANFSIKLGNDICCLGTPSVYRELINSNKHIFLIDKNPFICDFFKNYNAGQIINIDIMSINSIIRKYDVIIMDPPWYLSYIRSWLSKALDMVRSNGVIILTIFPKFIRPNAIKERKNLFQLLNKIGTYEFLPFETVYKTPKFENETLIANGLKPLEKWRKGETIIIRLKDKLPKIKYQKVKEPNWTRFRVGNQIIAFRKLKEDKQKNIYIKSPYLDGSYILKDVSRRNSIRSKINLWTSRNRVMIVYGFDRVYSFLKKIQDGKPPSTMIDNIAKNQSERNSIKLIINLIQ